MTDSPGHWYTHDILGNRTWRDWSEGDPGARLYVWDSVNRMDRSADEYSGAAYKYRADGMRINKVEGLLLDWIFDEESASGYYDEIWDANNPTTRYFHDGQMPVEEDFTRPVDEQIVVDVTRYGIGARGIDFIAKDPYNASETLYFPIYDGHGNNVGLVTRNGTGFTVSNRRAYDAWGNIRQGSTSGEPKQRYCANLGHVQDDESGLTYMRARYYEPWTGRFVSQDPGWEGPNLYVYCANDPINRIDRSGKNSDFDYSAFAFWGFFMAATAVMFGYLSYQFALDPELGNPATFIAAPVAVAACFLSIYFYSRALGASADQFVNYASTGIGMVLAGLVVVLAKSLDSAGKLVRFAGIIGAEAAIAAGAYAAACTAALLWAIVGE